MKKLLTLALLIALPALSFGGGAISSGASSTVSATDLDIRDLDSSQDSVSASITNASLSVDNGGTTFEVKEETFATVTVSSASVSNASATQLLGSNASRKGHLICSEGIDAIHVGGSSAISQVIGVPAQAGACGSLDGPGPYTGPIWAIALGSSSVRVQVLETTP